MQSQPGLEVKIDEDKYIEVDEVVKGENEHLAVLDSLISKWETQSLKNSMHTVLVVSVTFTTIITIANIWI